MIAHCLGWAANNGLTVRRDSYGNVALDSVAGADPVVVFAAHMDHPGFEISDVSGALVEAKWMGSVEPDYFPGAKVKVFSDPPTTGVCVKTEQFPERRRVDRMFLDLEGPVNVGDSGSWNVPEWHLEGALAHARAADGLAGCAAVLGAVTVLAAEGVPSCGLLTRAEEVGSIGALGAMCAGTPILSIAASKTVGPVRQGDGPVVRVGDKGGVFDAALCRFLGDVATSIKDRHADFEWQRALMDGGTCEATAYSLFGRPSAGLALPLGNHHNRSDDGQRLTAETLHVGDFFGCVVLMVEAARRLADPEAAGPGESLSAYRRNLVSQARAGLERLEGDPLLGAPLAEDR